jgi:FMN phosphatase YigB (HAD superfamily)
VFDIDDTILDVSQRYKDAKRARIIDKEGYPVRKKTLETPGKARKRANQFLFSPENLRKDRLIPGALGLVEDLAAQGHTIAYVTARHSNFREVTRNQLEDKGFPLFQDETGSELLFLKAKQSEDSGSYKGDIYAKLNSNYDIRMVFDDRTENLQAAVAVGITGVYPSIRDYTKYQVDHM